MYGLLDRVENLSTIIMTTDLSCHLGVLHLRHSQQWHHDMHGIAETGIIRLTLTGSPPLPSSRRSGYLILAQVVDSSYN